MYERVVNMEETVNIEETYLYPAVEDCTACRPRQFWGAKAGRSSLFMIGEALPARRELADGHAQARMGSKKRRYG